jgi:hypothetical protein
MISQRVVADNNFGRGCRVRQLVVLHGDRLPVLRPRCGTGAPG